MRAFRHIHHLPPISRRVVCVDFYLFVHTEHTSAFWIDSHPINYCQSPCGQHIIPLGMGSTNMRPGDAYQTVHRAHCTAYRRLLLIE